MSNFDKKADNTLVFDSSLKKWERQPTETKSEFKYFSFYLTEQVKNSKTAIQKTTEYFDRKRKYIGNISWKNKWQERAEEYNNYLADEQRAEFEKEYKARCKEAFIQIGATSQIIGQKLSGIVRELQKAGKDEEAIKEITGGMSLVQISQIQKNNFDIMSKILGIPEEQKVTVKGDVAVENNIVDVMTEKLEKLSPEKREEYLALQAEMNDR